MLNDKARQAIIDHAKACYPRESCGVIVGKEYIACTNIAAHQAQFEICPIDLVGASKEGKIRAYVHSHPDGSTNPSMPDRVQMNLHALPWIITNGIDIAIHEPDSYTAPLLGREYHHGLMDCYTLVKDYYQRELGIYLNDYKRKDEWWTDDSSESLYVNNFKNEGFLEVDTIQRHDIVLARLGRTHYVNHALIFVGNGQFKSEHTQATIGDSLVLHHPYNRISIREIYGEQWRRRASIIIRHKSLMQRHFLWAQFMKTIKLHGVLADKFGDSFTLDVQSALEATHAIACQLPEFKIFMLKAEQEGMRFAVFLDEQTPNNNIGENEIENTTSASVIHIVPKIMGAGGDTMGWLQVIGGALLVGVGVFTANPYLVNAGIGLMIGGAASLLMPTPELGNQDEDGNKASYGFGGAVTTVAQGNPVPIAYGERSVGGFICSASVYAEDTQ